MTDPQPLLQLAAPFALVALRLAGMFLGAPLISTQAVSPRIRALLAVMLAAAVFPALPDALHHAPDVDLVGLAGLAVAELLLGVSIGVLAAIPLTGLMLGGHMMGHQMGLAIAQSFNPETNSDSSAVGQLLYFLGVYTFLALGGLDALLVGVLSTFEHVPVGSMALTDAPLDLFLGVLSSSWELAVRVAAPVLGVILMVLIAMGVIMKTMPQINILSIGFAVKILVGLGTLTFTLIAVEEAVGDELLDTLDAILLWTANAR
jgi:flagellar biosynthetic protein FliR